MSANKELTVERPSLSSEQALDDYFTALLGDENFESDELFVDECDDESQSEEPEPEPERQLATHYSSYAEIRAAEFEVPNLEDVQKLLSRLEATNIVDDLNLDELMDQNTQKIAQQADMPMFDAAVESVQVFTEPEIQDWNLPEPELSIVAEPQIELQQAEDELLETEQTEAKIEYSEIEVEAPEVEVQEPDIETVIEPETQVGGADQFTSWESTVRTEDFQVLYFDVNGVTFAVPLDELGGIHRLEELSHIIGKPAWYLGLQTNRDSQLDVVDTAKWVMSEKLSGDEYKENYQYIVMLGESLWGLAGTELKGTELLNTDKVRWREMAGKRPWLAGMVKEKMCALIHVEALIAMLNAGLDVKALS
ncbi:chemotaxis protein CheW [Vibrio cyclitrophicus ZF270]|uniref:chemotaxis protein CheW n=1 Tax=Vibrio cyclitrophicus TaxID=47951 RepID=UPI0002EF7364|nr:chemotaxis protein CheW [Vibrio cyclitrophicus]OEE06934.1 chemotaxis protein CheW [Vibrio cyclitrophicus ZF270]PMF26326.1 chemotaxis protein CheW [Vibrio cyclitrophicus]PMP19516.1 chemotaxis protein CheW [Vibrio cyclitrophicus]PMP54790.1 chemotaxis protein CheW [Vibrio cyclitrophicus]